jgi:hypothetical protein
MRGCARRVPRTAVRKWLRWAVRTGFAGRAGILGEPGAAFVVATNDTPLDDGYVRLGWMSS